MTKALAIKDLKKTYKNGTEALNGIDLEVEQGDFFALLGPNGAGKTTAIGIICSLIRKSGGQVAVFGHDTEKEWREARSRIGLVPQEFNFNMWEPVVEIVVNQAGYYGIERTTAFEKAEFLLKKLGLWEKRRQVARSLSGGMKRRLMIARALVHAPKLLILDEPTAGVDIEIRRSMWQFLREINAGGTTIILTTHYLEEAENLCKHIAIINHGVIVEHSAMETLLRKLQMETFVLNLAVETDRLPELSGYTLRLDDEHTLEVDVEREQDLNSLFTGLSAHGMEVLSMRNKTNRLEELFMWMVNDSVSVKSQQGKTG